MVSMDAISFVLGIKSSHLRSSHLRDLVYRGRVLKTSKINDDGSAAVPNGHTNGDSGASDEETQSQKPSRNDPKSAWVMAVYEDDAGDEQRWKRTITNSGTSEYRINDRVVSQQQYTEAMESENILIKARNFLVFQGDVEAIAQQSPKDLTRLIEQISGSLEHKAEYEQLQEEAEKAAEEQNYTLHRRRGINSEIKQYQEQKREAENFQNKADERDQAIVTQILRKLWRFQSTIDESTSAIQEHKENLKEYRRGVEKYEHALNEARGEQSKVNKDVSKVERHIASIEKEIEAKQDNELTVIEGRIEHLTGTSNKSRKKAEGLKKDQDEKVEEINDLKKQLSKVEQAQKHFEAEWKDKLRKQGKQQLSDTDLKEYRTLRAVVATKTSNNQTELDNLLRQKSTDEVTINSLRTKVEGSEAQVQKLQGEVAEITEKRDTTKTVVRELTQEVDAKKKEFNHMQFERVQNNQIWTEAEEKLQEILKQLDEADDGRRRNDKDARAREMVAAMKKLYPGVKGRVGDLCQPKQKKYAEAVIVALGHDFESVIVDTEQTGVACVNYLKEQHFGIMTFVPLDNVKVSTVSSKLKSLPKARLTIDTIDFDSSVERAMSYACSDSIICDDMATARDITYGKNIQVKAVTLDGALIHKNRAMTGGKGPDRGNKRKFNDKDYENLTTLAQRKKDDMKKMPRPSRNSAAEDALQQELASLDQRLAFAKGQLADFERNLASKKKEMDHEKKSLNELKPRYEAKLSSLEALEEKVDEFEASVAKVQDQVFADFCKKTCYDNIRVYEDQQGNLEHEASEKRSNFNTHKQKLQTQTNWVDREMKLLADRIKNLQQEVKNWEKEMEGFEAEKETCESEIDQLRAQVTEAEDRKHKLKEKLAARTEKVNTARNEVAKRSKEIDSRTKAITALEGELYRSCSQRHGLLRHCKLNQINIPLAEGSRKLDTLPEDGTVQTDPNAMDVDEGEEGDEATEAATDYGILIDFDELDEDFKNVRIITQIFLLQYSDSLHSPTTKKSKLIWKKRCIPSTASSRNSIRTCVLSTVSKASRLATKSPKRTLRPLVKAPKLLVTSSTKSRRSGLTSSTKHSPTSPSR